MALPGGGTQLKVTELEITRVLRQSNEFTHRFTCKGVVGGRHVLIEGGFTLRNCKNETIDCAQVTITRVASNKCSQRATLRITGKGIGQFT